MKKSFLLVIILLILLVFCAYFVVCSIFPKAEPIDLPEIDNVISVQIENNNDICIDVEKTDFQCILDFVENSKPTRKMSVNDYPAVNTYYTIVVETADKVYRMFLYSENSDVYIEVAYEGIHKSSQSALDFVVDCYNKAE